MAPVDLFSMFNIPRNKKIIGIVGRIEEYKGHEDLLTAISLLSTDYQDRIQVVFVGKGEVQYVSKLVHYAKFLQIKSEVLVAGYIDGNIFEVISNFNLLCSLTRNFEGFGLTIAEAMVSGVPVLATKVGGVIEFVDNNNATLIEPSDVSGIYEFLESFLKDDSLYLRKAEMARKNIGQFSSEKMSMNFHRHIKSKIFFNSARVGIE